MNPDQTASLEQSGLGPYYCNIGFLTVLIQVGFREFKNPLRPKYLIFMWISKKNEVKSANRTPLYI